MATAEALQRDGAATLGDLGSLDAEGYLYLTDRKSHMIVSGGVNIYPQEAETVLSQHPLVADVAVIGVPDDGLGEVAKAIIVFKGALNAELAGELIEFCRARLNSIKCPRSVDFVDLLPRSDTGKLLKRQLREGYWREHETLIV